MGFAVFPQQMGWSFLFIDSAIRWLGGSDLELGVFIFPIDSLFNGDPISYLEVPNHLIAVVHIPTIPFPPICAIHAPPECLVCWFGIGSLHFGYGTSLRFWCPPCLAYLCLGACGRPLGNGKAVQIHSAYAGDQNDNGNDSMNTWLVVWNMNFMTFHSVGNVIILTDELHHFSEG